MIKKILLPLLLACTAMAANPDPSNQFKFGDGAAGNKVLKFNRNNGGANPVIQWTESANTLQFSNDGTNFSDIGSGSGSGGAGINVLTNPGFESGIAQGWSNTGGVFLAVSSGSNLLIGKGSATFQTGASNNFIVSSQVTIPNGLAGKSCAASMMYKGGDANLKFEVIDGSSNILASTVLSAQTISTTVPLTFVCPSSGTFAVKLISTAASALIAIDQMSLGDNQLFNVSQAQYIGSLTYPTNATCSWNTSSSTYTNLTAAGGCSTPVTDGQVSAPGTVIPALVLNVKPGKYVFRVTGATGGTHPSGNLIDEFFRFTDGTNFSTEENNVYWSSVTTVNGSTHFAPVIEGSLTYTSAQSNVTVQMQAKTLGVAAVINATEAPLTISVYYFPTQAETAMRPDMLANSWSGYHLNDCGWSFGTSYSDPTYSACTFGERNNVNFGTVASLTDGTAGHLLPGIVFSPSRVGTYFVCAIFSSGSNPNLTVAFKMIDGSGNSIADSVEQAVGSTNSVHATNSLCGIYRATNVSPVTIKLQGKSSSSTSSLNAGLADSTINWTLFQIDQQIPAPLLVNSVVSDSSGVEKVARAKIDNCTSDPCTVLSQSGSVSVVNRIGAGTYTVHFSAGAFSSTPSCIFSDTADNANEFCKGTGTSSTTANVFCQTTDTPNAADVPGIDMVCMGPK